MHQERPTQRNELAVSAYVQLVRTAEALHARVSQGLIEEGLTASQFSTLKVLRMRGPQSQKDIANYLLKTGGNITLVVDNLVRRKLVLRGNDPNDRRIALVELTPLGTATFDRVYPSHLQRIHRAMESLSIEQLNLLADLLECVESPAPAVCVT
jgi:MarR family transcriptional regulator, 2-MHQ and catechol-resistance regulon repressor